MQRLGLLIAISAIVTNESTTATSGQNQTCAQPRRAPADDDRLEPAARRVFIFFDGWLRASVGLPPPLRPSARLRH
jgi:hypothetical protein